jgi:YHS domain-containing protein
VQGPEKYLNELGVTIPCAVNPSRKAVLDSAHRSFVNYEAYYFCDETSMSKFVAAPYRYTGKVTDPVTRERFVPTASSLKRSYGSRLFYFVSTETVQAFDKNPIKYGTLMPGMREAKPVAK